MNPLVTIGIITYNRPDCLPDAVNSALEQDVETAFEVLIVNDGSGQKTKYYLESISDPRVKVVSSHTNQGIPKARNLVIEHMNGDFLIWLDDDDCLTSDAISSNLNCLKQHNNADVIYGNIYICNELMNPIGNYNYRMDEHFVLHNFIFACAVPNLGTMIRKKLFDRVGNYNLNFPRGQDYDFWVNAALRKCKFYHNDNYIAFYRQRSQKYSYDKENIKIVNNILCQASLKEIFPMYNWEKELAKSQSYSLTTLAMIFYKYKDIKTAISYNLKSIKIFPNEINKALMRILYEADENWKKAENFPKANPYIQDVSLKQALSIDRHELEVKLRRGLC